MRNGCVISLVRETHVTDVTEDSFWFSASGLLTAVTLLQFRVAEISNFSKAFSSVQFSSFLFSQNTIQYKNTYRNCKVARELRRNQKALRSLGSPV